MKIQDFNLLKSQKDFSNLYLLVCKEEEKKFYFEEIFHLFLKKQSINESSVALKKFSQENFSLESFKQEIHSKSFLFPYLFIYVSQIEKIKQADLKIIASLVEKIDDQVCCVFSCTHLAPQSFFYKTIDQKGIVFQKTEEKVWEKEKSLVQWLIQLSSMEKKHLDPKAAQLLLKQVGYDREFLKSELFKLICFVGNRQEITLQDVKEIGTQVPLDNLWQLGDALFQKELSKALSISRGLLQEGVNLFSLFAQLRSQLQSALEILALYTQGGANLVVGSFPHLKGGFLEKKIQLYQLFGEKKIKHGLMLLHQFDVFMRNFTYEPAFLLELFIIHLIHGTSPSSFAKSIK